MQNQPTEEAPPPDEKTLRLNAGLIAIDGTVQAASFSPAEQLGMLFMAHVLATKRLLRVHGVNDRGRRLRVIRAAVAEFESKLREYVKPDAPKPDGTAVFVATKGDLSGA